MHFLNFAISWSYEDAESTGLACAIFCSSLEYPGSQFFYLRKGVGSRARYRRPDACLFAVAMAATDHKVSERHLEGSVLTADVSR